MPPEPAPSARRGPRAPLFALLAGGVIAGFGLGALVLALLLPAPVAAPLPPPEMRTPQPGTANPPEVRSWPAAFGTTPAPEPPAPPAPEPPAEEADEEDEDDTDYLPYTEHDYRLRGMVAQAGEPGASQEGGGWALIESEIGIEVVRVGSELSGGETIIEITPYGVILQGFGPEFLLSFSDDDGYDDFGGFDSFDDSDDPDDDTPPPRFGP